MTTPVQTTDPATADAALVRVVALHAAVVGVPVLVLALVAQLWILALPLALVVAIVVTALRVRGTDRRVAQALGARPIDPAAHPRVLGLTESVAMASGTPVPHVHTIDSDSLNSISWGVGNAPSHLAITTGLLDAADPIALEAVVGHHLCPARTRVVEATTLAAALFGPLAKGPLIAPVVSLVEGDEERSVVLADLDGVRATRYPPGLVRALELVRSGSTELAVPAGFSGLCFAAPGAADDPFAVHPPLDDRIDLLREI